MTTSENQRQYDVLDQTLSMHASLRDIYERRALVLHVLVLVSSAFIAALIFVDSQFLSDLGLVPQVAKLCIGLASAIVFGLSLVEYRLDWKNQSKSHQSYADRLSVLKADFRRSYEQNRGENTQENARLTDRYNALMLEKIPIPEKQFFRLKARHLFKKRLSAAISANPDVPLWVLRIKFRMSGIKKEIRLRVRVSDRGGES